MKKYGLSLLFVFSALFLGCDHNDTSSTPEFTETVPTIKIGLIPEHDIFQQLERYRPLADYLNQKCDINIQMKALTQYGNIVANFQELKLDAAFLGSFTYALCQSVLGLEVVGRPEAEDGTSTYYGMIFVRKDSNISNAHDMKGKTFVFVDKATTAGYLLPLAYFKKNGIRDYKTYFRTTYFSGTHEDAINDVLNGLADIGAAKNTVYFRLEKKDQRIKNELVVLEKSPEVPENALAFRKEIDDGIKHRMKVELLDMHNHPDGRKALAQLGARKFIETSDEDYESVYHYAETIGLDLAHYDYMNE